MLKRLSFFLLLLGVLAGAGLVTYNKFIFRPTFPILVEQSYLGSINVSGELHTFYIEKLDVDKVVLLVLSPGEKARTVTLEQAPRTLFNDLYLRYTEKKPEKVYAPIEVVIKNTTYTLRGEEKDQLLQGPVEIDGETLGSWVAAPYEAETRFIQRSGEDMQAWLALTRRKTLLDKRLDNLARSSIDHEGEARLYRDLLASDSLSQRAEKTKAELEREVYLLNGQITNAKEQLSDLVDELALHSRISNEGKAVLLSRRVSRRENKWYLANWGEKSRAGDSEFLAAQNMGINLETLNRAARRAQEIRRLQLEILKERQKIEQLIKPRMESPSQSEEDSGVAAPGQEQEQPRKKRRKLFGIF